MEKHLLTKAHMAKFNRLTESEVTELISLIIDETGLAILNRPESREITILSSQSLTILDILVNPYSPK